MTLFQALATAAGFDPDRGPGSSCQGNGKCVLPWGSGTKAVSSIVLIAHGMSFAVRRFAQFNTMIHLSLLQFVMLVIATISPIADYRMFGRWLLLISTAICWAAQFASITLTCGFQYLKHHIGCALSSILSSISSEPLEYRNGTVYDQLHFERHHSRIYCGTFPPTGSQYSSLT